MTMSELARFITQNAAGLLYQKSLVITQNCPLRIITISGIQRTQHLL